MRNNIGYHTRLYSDHRVKVCGGSFGGAINAETVERIVSAMFTVTVKPSGTAVFVDKQGREVRLYLSVDPDTTEAGKQAMKAYWQERHRRDAIAEAERQELMDQLDSLSADEIRELLASRAERKPE